MKTNEKNNNFLEKIKSSDKTTKILFGLGVAALVVVIVGLGLFVKIKHDQKERLALNGMTDDSSIGEPIPDDYREAAEKIVEEQTRTDAIMNIYDDTLPEDGAVDIEYEDSVSRGVIDYIGSSDSMAHAIGSDKTYLHANIVMTFNNFYPLNITNVMFRHSDGTVEDAKVKVKVNDGDWVDIESLTAKDFGNYDASSTDAEVNDCVFSNGDSVEIIAYVDKLDNFSVAWSSPDNTKVISAKSYNYDNSEKPTVDVDYEGDMFDTTEESNTEE